MSTEHHKKDAPTALKIGIITISTTRSLANDESGTWISDLAKKHNYDVIYHQVIPDDAQLIQKTVLKIIKEQFPHALLLTGGTGLSEKDVTIEAVHPLFQKELTAFGSLFAQESFKEIGSSAIMSRATAGIIGKTAVFCMPGSLNACKLACKNLIFPEMGHIARHVLKG